MAAKRTQQDLSYRDYQPAYITQTLTLPQRILQNDNNTVTLSFYLNHCLPTFYNQSKAPLSKRIQQAANFSYSNIYTLQKRPFIFQVSLFNC